MTWYDITGTVADWVMAGAAAYAAFNAKQWFSQRSHTKGFDKAEEILSNIDLIYRTTYISVEKLNLTHEYLNMIGSGLKKANISDVKEYETLENNHSNMIAKIDKLIEELELIERWSIKVKKKEIILAVTKSLRDANVSAVNAYKSVQSNIYDLDSDSKIGFKRSNATFKLRYDDYLSEIAASETLYKVFKSQNFITFFKVKWKKHISEGFLHPSAGFYLAQNKGSNSLK